MVPSLRMELRNFAAALNVLPLSDKNLRGSPRLAVNLFKHRRNVSVDKSQTMSRWIPRVTRQVKTQIHALDDVLVKGPFLTERGPAKSTPVYVNAGFSLTLKSGSGGGGGPWNGAPSYLLQVVHPRMIVFVRLLPLMIQYLLRTSVRVSFTPL